MQKKNRDLANHTTLGYFIFLSYFKIGTASAKKKQYVIDYIFLKDQVVKYKNPNVQKNIYFI